MTLDDARHYIRKEFTDEQLLEKAITKTANRELDILELINGNCESLPKLIDLLEKLDDQYPSASLSVVHGYSDTELNVVYTVNLSTESVEDVIDRLAKQYLRSTKALQQAVAKVEKEQAELDKLKA